MDEENETVYESNAEERYKKIKDLLVLIIILTLLFTLAIYFTKNIISIWLSLVIFVILFFIFKMPKRIFFYMEYKIYKIIDLIALEQSYNVSRKEKLEKIDFTNDHSYYRDVIKKYSAAELLYIDEFNTKESYKTIVITLLRLELKKIIKIDNGYISIISNDTEDLKLSEIYIISCIKNGKVVIDTNGVDIYEYIKDEAYQDNLIEKTKKFKFTRFQFKIIFVLLLLLVIIVGFPFLTLYIKTDYLLNLLWCIYFICSFILTPLYVLYIFAFYYQYLRHQKESYVRTEKGSEINYKLEGLKNYIKDFSSLNEKEKQELTLWDDYLIYSVMFNLNDKVINEFNKLIIFKNS